MMNAVPVNFGGYVNPGDHRKTSARRVNQLLARHGYQLSDNAEANRCQTPTTRTIKYLITKTAGQTDEMTQYMMGQTTPYGDSYSGVNVPTKALVKGPEDTISRSWFDQLINKKLIQSIHSDTSH